MLSAPNQWAAEGPVRATPANVLFGSFSGRMAAKTAEKISRPSQTTEAQNQNPSFFLRYRASTSVASAGWIPTSVSASATSSTDISHPWVESGVEQIDEEVDQHEADSDDDHHALHDEEVLL